MEMTGFGPIGKTGGGGGGGAVTSVAGRTGDVLLGEADIANLTTDLAAKAPLASPALTGAPTVPTAVASDNSTKAASTAYADAAVAVEATARTNADTLLAPKASPTFTGTVTLPSGLILPASVVLPSTAVGTTQTASDNSTKVATTAYADAAVGVETTRATTAEALKAPLASPTLTGTPAAPTAAQGTNTTQIATTAMVHSEAALLAPLASPTLTGTPSLPTGTTGVTQAQTDSSTKLATTAFVQGMNGAIGGPPKIVRRTSDSSSLTANTTLQADDTLLWSVGANDVWYFIGRLLFTAADSTGTSTTEDLKVGWSVPASATMAWGTDGNASNNVAGYGPALTTASPNVMKIANGTLSVGAAAGMFGLGLSGIVVMAGTSGTVNFKWAQNTSDNSTLVCNANSFFLAWRVA